MTQAQFLKIIDLTPEDTFRDWYLIPASHIISVHAGGSPLYVPEGYEDGFVVVFKEHYDDNGYISQRATFSRGWCTRDDWGMFLRGDIPDPTEQTLSS